MAARGGAVRVAALTGEHVAFVVEADLAALAAEHGVAAPKDLFGARGQGQGIYLSDPDGNGVELRTYPTA